MITLDVSSMFASTAGGIRTYYEAKARYLPAASTQCHFVVPGRRRETQRLGASWLHRVPGPPIGAGYRAFGDIAALRALVRDIAPDVIEIASHYLLPQLLPSTSARVVGFYHADVTSTYVEPALAWSPPVQRLAVAAAWQWMRRQHERYALTLAGSHQVAAKLTAHGIPRVRWVGLGVDAQRFRPAPRSSDPVRRIGYAGRLASDKELDVLLDAAPLTSAARIVIAGAGPRVRDVQALARRGVVDYVGLVSPANMPTFLQGIDALVVPGRYESFSLISAEAFACGTPVIAPDLGGASELVEQSGGGLRFRAGDAGALADAIEDLYALSDAERLALGVRGRDHALGELTWERVFARLHTLYEEVRCSS